MLSLLECSELYDRLSRREEAHIFILRFGSVRVEVAPGHSIYSRQIKFYNWFFNHWIHEYQLELCESGPKISLHDYFTVIYTFTYYSWLLDASNLSVLKQIKAVLDNKLDLESLATKALEILLIMLTMGSICKGDTIGPYYLFDLKIREFDCGKNGGG